MKPIVKWPGGKVQLLPKIKELLPATYNKYFEPFLGGGALLLELNPREACVNDINPELVNMYVQIKEDVEGVIRELTKFDYDHSVSQDPKEYYYTVRYFFNKNLRTNTSEQAARFIYLNKHCFNGLYRVNKKGEFNVPFNGKLAGRSFDAEHLRKVSKQLQDTMFTSGDFKDCIYHADKSDLIYFDPPYDYETGTGFVEYTSDGWTRDTLICLKKLCDTLVDRGCYILVSNNSTTFVKELFNDGRYNTIEIPARRSINRNGTGRGFVPEVIIQSKNCKN